MKQNEHGVKVGDIFYSNWGYEQTNIDFFEVVATTAKMVAVKPIECNKNENGYLQGEKTPKRGAYVTNSGFYKEQYKTRTAKSHFGDEPILKNVDGHDHLGFLYKEKPVHYSEYY
ncbi:hypothetical protein LJC04_06065 [Ruminococcaceae bacterium OttesenSCG-928-O06]|nr:hypothetical protein [Ruminococcaceae bacterium OttesenSCG-928-O06]